MSRTENLTVMFTDIVNFTARTSRQSRAETQAMLLDHDRLLLPLINRFAGHRVKSIGDALLVRFRSPTDAVRCGMAMQDALSEFNIGRPASERLEIRVALNVGEVRVDRNDIFGEAVNVASRVEQLTPPGAVYFTEAVYLAMNKAEVPSEAIGIEQLRGIPEPVKLYRVPQRKINRLIPGHEDLGNQPGELPYGGMHRVKAPRGTLATFLTNVDTVGKMPLERALAWLPRLTALPPARRALPLMATLLLTCVLAVWLQLGPPAIASSSASRVQVAEPVLDAAADQAMPALSPEAQRRRDALAWLDKGHRAFEEERRPDAALAYGEALTLHPQLEQDALLAKRLVACLSWASEQAEPLIRAHPSQAVIAALAERSGDVGTRGAERAADLLVELGHASRVAPLYDALADLDHSASCDGKKDAIRRLRALGDPRALPSLHASIGSGVRGWFASSCFRSDAKDAIKAIERASKVAG